MLNALAAPPQAPPIQTASTSCPTARPTGLRRAFRCLPSTAHSRCVSGVCVLWVRGWFEGGRGRAPHLGAARAWERAEQGRPVCRLPLGHRLTWLPGMTPHKPVTVCRSLLESCVTSYALLNSAPPGRPQPAPAPHCTGHRERRHHLLPPGLPWELDGCHRAHGPRVPAKAPPHAHRGYVRECRPPATPPTAMAPAPPWNTQHCVVSPWPAAWLVV